jgi:hypothetical protein
MFRGTRLNRVALIGAAVFAVSLAPAAFAHGGHGHHGAQRHQHHQRAHRAATSRAGHRFGHRAHHRHVMPGVVRHRAYVRPYIAYPSFRHSGSGLRGHASFCGPYFSIGFRF